MHIFVQHLYNRGVRAERLLARFGSPRAVYEAEAEEWRECVGNSAAEALERQKKSGEWEREYGQLSEQQIHFFAGGERISRKLAEIPDPPYGIFYRGKLPDENEPAVAVIGARECSEYGRYVAEELGQYLGRAGIQVISGMARGLTGSASRQRYLREELPMVCWDGSGYLLSRTESKIA